MSRYISRINRLLYNHYSSIKEDTHAENLSICSLIIKSQYNCSQVRKGKTKTQDTNCIRKQLFLDGFEREKQKRSSIKKKKKKKKREQK